MILDGILGSEAIDSSGEVLDVAGADISDVDKGTLLLNWEHEPGEKGASTLVGKVISARKIYSEDDCENDRQRMYWNEIKLPFIYGVMRLRDGAGHEEAKRIAALIRDDVANGEMIVCRFSVEGSTLDKEGNRLKESIIRRVAVTVKPCNRTANAGLIEDPNAPPGFEKKHVKEPVKDLLDFEDAEKSESSHPLLQRLGASTTIACNPIVEDLSKAYEAGVASAAPSALTGGAALQREHIGRSREDVKKKALDVLREYSEREDFDKAEFRTFAKMHMPEASDDFLDHFERLAEDYHVKRKQLSKKEGGKSPAPAKVKPATKPAAKAKPKAEQPVSEEEPDESAVKIDHGTIRGVPTQPIKMRGYKFDEENGILHTPKGSFPLYNPDKGFGIKEHAGALKPFYENGTLHVAPGTDMASVPHNAPNPGFRQIFNSQPIEEFHSGKVMPNFIRVHELTKAGKLPEEVVLHSAMFSMMSPNTPVPMHEKMYAHLVDTMEDLGIDPRDPDFKNARRHWLDQDQADVYPRLARDYFKGHKGIHLGNDSEKGRKAGQQMGFMLGENKFSNVEQYHKLHSTLVDIVKRHGTDTRAATAELMAHKAKEGLWKNQRRAFSKKIKEHATSVLGLRDELQEHIDRGVERLRALGQMGKKGESKTGDSAKKKAIVEEGKKLGLADRLSEHVKGETAKKFGEYQGVAVPGLAPKTGRFTFSMLGGGNSFVPDTHIIRHLFGMDAAKDGDTLAYLKSVLWNAKNSHVLEGVDRWYAKNHPAPLAMQQHPTWGKYFKDDKEQANFPAFWRHWCSIAQDERNRGMDNGAFNEFSTHEPFWLGIDKYVNPDVKKHEGELDKNLIGRLLALHKQYESDYGEVPASMMFYTHLVPHLIESSQYRERHDDASDFMKALPRLHALEIELRKAIADVREANLADPEIPTVHALYLRMNGSEHRAGRFAMAGQRIHHLEDYYGLLRQFLPEGPVTTKTLSTVHGMKMSPSLRLDAEPIPSSKTEEDHADVKPEQLGSFGDAMRSASRPPPVFSYQRAGMDRPHTLEVNQGKYLLDGSPLTHEEVGTIVGNVRARTGTIRYKTVGARTALQKMEDLFETLMKDEDAPRSARQDILAAMRAAEAAGHLPPGTSDDATKHFYFDPMMPGVGNQHAWLDFKSKNKPGVYFAGDGTDFSAINNAFGHGVGDDALRAYGHAMKSAMKESGAQGKLFRAGGDEMNAWFPSHEHAMKFARALHQKLEGIPAIQGHHKLSMGMGLGVSPDQADQALYTAKENKYLPGQEAVPARERKRAFPVGQAPNMMHSLVPGHEGPVPMHDPQVAAAHSSLSTPQPMAQANSYEHTAPTAPTTST